jgi:putative GTP pyrophosphokinase
MPDMDAAEMVRAILAVENVYAGAAREISTKLENLNDEFRFTMDRNPIHSINTRIKTPKSISDKLKRKGYDLNFESAKENLDDIAGVRVICSYINDIYMIADFLTGQDDITLIRKADYIKNPKPNGYRSLHLVVTVPVFLHKRTEIVKVEVQIRTIAMDFWASLEHDMAYKFPGGKSEEITRELKDCADVISGTDARMQKLYDMITGTDAP